VAFIAEDRIGMPALISNVHKLWMDNEYGINTQTGSIPVRVTKQLRKSASKPSELKRLRLLLGSIYNHQSRAR